MLYGVVEGSLLTIAAADDPAELDGLHGRAVADAVPGASVPDLVSFLQEPRYAGLHLPPVEVTLPADADPVVVAAQMNVSLLPHRRLLFDRHHAMVDAQAKKMWSGSDDQSIGDLVYPDGVDRHDQRSAEERKASGRKPAGGGGESFTDPAAPRPAIDDAAEAVVSDDPAILPGGRIAVFHKISATGQRLADLYAALEGTSYDLRHSAVVRRTTPTGCWVAVPSEGGAERLKGLLTAAGIATEHEMVTDLGQPVTAAAAVSDPVSLIRPWTDAAAWMALDNSARIVHRAAMEPKEFLFCGRYLTRNNGCVVYIAPRVWFVAEERLFDASLDIDHLLPRGLGEIHRGVYFSRNTDWVRLGFSLIRRGFIESVALQLFVNNQGSSPG